VSSRWLLRGVSILPFARTTCKAPPLPPSQMNRPILGTFQHLVHSFKGEGKKTFVVVNQYIHKQAPTTDTNAKSGSVS